MSRKKRSVRLNLENLEARDNPSNVSMRDIPFYPYAEEGGGGGILRRGT